MKQALIAFALLSLITFTCQQLAQQQSDSLELNSLQKNKDKNQNQGEIVIGEFLMLNDIKLYAPFFDSVLTRTPYYNEEKEFYQVALQKEEEYNLNQHFNTYTLNDGKSYFFFEFYDFEEDQSFLNRQYLQVPRDDPYNVNLQKGDVNQFWKIVKDNENLDQYFIYSVNQNKWLCGQSMYDVNTPQMCTWKFIEAQVEYIDQ